jgi:hypothetical protein
MGMHEVAGDGEPEAGAARSGRARKRLEQPVAGAGWQAGSVVGNGDDEAPVHRARRYVDAAGAGLQRVLAEIGEDAEQLVAIGLERDLSRDLIAPGHLAIGSSRQHGADLVDQRAQGEASTVERRRTFAGEGHGLAAEVDGAVDGGEQGRRQAPHLRIVAAGQAVGDELRRRQDVAQIVVDLGHGHAQCRQPRLLL